MIFLLVYDSVSDMILSLVYDSGSDYEVFIFKLVGQFLIEYVFDDSDDSWYLELL